MYFFFELVPSIGWKLIWDFPRFSTLVVSENPTKAWLQVQTLGGSQLADP